MASPGAHILAGPIGFATSDTGMHPDRTIQVLKWEFIGFTSSGELRRWNLNFSTETRKFTSTSLNVNHWEKTHSGHLADLYRPISVLRHMLPKGSVATAMKAMLSEKQLAEAFAISILGGKTVGDNP